MACCPAHKDAKPSLSVAERDGKILVHCQAGCTTEAVVSAMGLTMQDLFVKPKPQSWIFLREHIYFDEDSEPVTKKQLYDKGDGTKTGVWYRYENGEYFKGLNGLQAPLYNLPLLKMNHDTVFIAEGEKDCDTLFNMGYIATTSPNGAGTKWRSEYNMYLRGCDIFVLTDNDEPGRKHGEDVANALLSVAKSVKLIPAVDIYPEVQHKGDISDIVAQFGAAVAKQMLDRAVSAAQTLTDPFCVEHSTREPIKDINIKPADYSDAGNAEVFSLFYKDELIFVDALGWLFWNGKRWERDDHKSLELALKLSKQMLKDALTEYSEALRLEAEAKAAYAASGEESDGEKMKKAKAAADKAEAYLKHAKASRGGAKIKNMVDLSKPALAIRADKLDSNPFDLNTPAGIVNLRTGKIRPHDPAAYCSRITEAAPGLEGAETWQEFLNLVTGGDESIMGFLQLVAGMAAVGTVYHEGIILAYGGGGNGKSTFFNSLGAVFGDYSGTIDVKTLTTDRQNKGASLATLRGRRLVITGELEEHQRLSVATLKQLGSTDELTIEEKFKQPETVKQSHTLCLFTNHLPRVGSTDNGTWRRLTVVPFNTKISHSEAVQNYSEYLVEKAGGAIMSWIIEGAVNFCRNKFKLDIPDVIAEATENYRSQEDWLNKFIDERCIKDDNARVGARELYLAYCEWCMEIGDFKRRERDFAAAMETAGFQNIKPQNKSTWKGLKLDMSRSFENPYGATG